MLTLRPVAAISAGLISLALTLLAACAGPGQESGALTRVSSDYMNALFGARPATAAAIGLHQYDGRLDDVSSLALARRADELGRMLPRIQRIRTLNLPFEDDLDAAALEYRIRAELAAFQRLERWKRDPSFYLEIPLLSIDRTMRHVYAPASDRLKAVVISVNEIDAVLAAMRANLDAPSRAEVEVGLDTGYLLLDLLQNELPRWGTASAGVDTRLESSFSAGLARATSTVAQSLDWIRKHSLPTARSPAGIGAENFVIALLFDSMVEIRVSDLLSRAEQGIARYQQAVTAAAAKVSPGASFARVREDLAAASLPTGAAVSATNAAVLEILSIIRERDLFSVPPEIGGAGDERRYHIAATPSHRSAALRYFLFDPPMLAANSDKEGYLLLSRPDRGWLPSIGQEHSAYLVPAGFRLAAANAVVPGRYLQAVSLELRETLGAETDIRLLLESRVTREGWGYYAEQLLTDAGLGADDPFQELLLAHRSLLASGRFAACIRIHAQGASLEQAIQLFENDTYLTPEAARLEAVRCAADPLALAGALGKELITELREEYQREFGDQSLKAFHDAFLKRGPMPIPLLRRAILQQ